MVVYRIFERSFSQRRWCRQPWRSLRLKLPKLQLSKRNSAIKMQPNPTRLPAPLAATKPPAGRGDSHGVRQGVDVDVCGAAAIRACGGDGMDAVRAHVGE
jgi:hypothetical protein